MQPKLGVFSDGWTVQDVGVLRIDRRVNPKVSWSPCSMRVARIFLFAVISCSLSHGAFAQATAQAREAPLSPQQTESIDGFVGAEMARQLIPGLAVGIYSRGRILLAKGYGLANVELSVPVRAETIFQSGSVGKQFVSAAIMMLVEEGKLSLDDSITKYFPDAPSSWKPVLIKNLLSHTSGLSEYESLDRIGSKGEFYLRLDFTEDELVTKIEALPMEWFPGERWGYRNTNYVLLGITIHKVTGKPYAEYLQERIFKPLGMTSTRLVSDRDIIPNRSSGYDLEDGQLKNQAWVSPTFNSTADGTLYFNVIDLAKWDEALYTTRLLKQSSLDRIWTVYPLKAGKPNSDNYGFGWFVRPQNGHMVIEHGGAWQGFTCNISRYPDDSLSVVVLTNLDSAHSSPEMLSHVIAGLLEPSLLPAKLSPIADSQPAIATSLRTTLDHLVAGDDVRPQVSPELAARLTPDGMKWIQKSLSIVWPGGTLSLVKRNPVPHAQNHVSSIFRLVKDKGALLIVYVLSPDGKIFDFYLMPDRPYE